MWNEKLVSCHVQTCGEYKYLICSQTDGKSNLTLFAGEFVIKSKMVAESYLC